MIDAPLYAVEYRQGPVGALSRVDPRTLLPRGERRVTFRGYADGWGWSPDGQRLVVSARRTLRVVDVRRMRTVGTMRLPGWYVASWPRPRRLVTLSMTRPGRSVLSVVDPARRRVIARRRLDGQVADAQPTADGLAALLAPPAGIGPARLALAAADGSVRYVPLARIQAGSVRRPGAPPVTESRVPGLAVDPAGRRAAVVGTEGFAVADVDLRSGAVGYHDLPLGGATARVAKEDVQWQRTARWVGAGTLAVSGADVRGPSEPRRPFGLHLVDTRAWTVRAVDPRPSLFEWTGERLLVPGKGLLGYDLAGRLRYRRLATRTIARLDVNGRYAYARVPEVHRTYVIDARSGRTVRVLRTTLLPQILARQAS